MTRRAPSADTSHHTSDQHAGSRSNDWLPIGLGVAAVGWGANQFAPLLLMYRSELAVSAATVQAAYGIYALGLVPGLLLGGPLSDRHGRRRVMVTALITSMAGSLLLIVGGQALVGLFAGRLVAGVASGAAFSAGTAWIKELSAGTASDPGPGARRATVAMTAGFAGGPLVAGLVAQVAPVPTASAYVPHIALIIVAIPFTVRATETRTPNPDVALWSPLRLPARSARRFRRVALPLAPWVFGASSIGLAYLPGSAADRMGNAVLLFSAMVTAATMISGILVQPLARRVQHPTKPSSITTALAIVVAGLLRGALSGAHPLLVGASALVLGAGYGCCLVAGLTEVHRLAGSHNLASLTAVFQAVAYTGFCVPYLLAVFESALSPAVLLCVTAVLAGFTLAWTVREAVRNPPDDPASGVPADGARKRV
ncbi:MULTISPECIES: MFS transporter [Prauserella salsuginis group]|uniref:MFS transporter n=1 Tax=Prauserella salsuginis TaxID=387889 RepID=A0ABW6G7W0_9PSEU|nr:MULTISPECIES: MFS transporter [Prauserella salsuginis group]MCR3719634.1 Major Facilitator Superfamily protein [Prauserella flava]MCR3735352.1 Major Facilitator Superfamily protein [Prauserella salsuginis]